MARKACANPYVESRHQRTQARERSPHTTPGLGEVRCEQKQTVTVLWHHRVATRRSFKVFRPGEQRHSSRTRFFRRQLVEHGPECTDYLDRFHEFVEIERLDDVGIHTKLVAPYNVLLFTR